MIRDVRDRGMSNREFARGLGISRIAEYRQYAAMRQTGETVPG